MTGCVWNRSTSGHVRTNSQAPAPRSPSPFDCASISSKTMRRTVAASEKVYRLWADPAESPRAAARAEGLSRLWADPASSAADY